MAAMLPSGIPQLIVKQKLLTDELAKQAKKDAASNNLPYAQWITEQNLVDADELATVISKNYGSPYFNLGRFQQRQCAH